MQDVSRPSQLPGAEIWFAALLEKIREQQEDQQGNGAGMTTILMTTLLMGVETLLRLRQGIR